jgi:hypothetical protein
MSVGNVYRQEYEKVVEEIVWNPLQRSLEPLVSVVDKKIARLPKKAGEMRRIFYSSLVDE